MRFTLTKTSHPFRRLVTISDVSLDPKHSTKTGARGMGHHLQTEAKLLAHNWRYEHRNMSQFSGVIPLQLEKAPSVLRRLVGARVHVGGESDPVCMLEIHSTLCSIAIGYI